MIASSDIRAYVINLRRRFDRRAWITRLLPSGFSITFTSDWIGPFDGHELCRSNLERAGYQLFPWQIDSNNPWWSRPLKYGEIGCTLAHMACWRHASRVGSEPFVLVLEDDAILASSFIDDLLSGLERLSEFGQFDLLYLGRYPLEPDKPALPGFVFPGYSHCTFGYLVTHRALDIMLATHLEHALVPIDEFLPSLSISTIHVSICARFPRQLTALAFDPPLVRQRPKHEAGSDTEDSAFIDG